MSRAASLKANGVLQTLALGLLIPAGFFLGSLNSSLPLVLVCFSMAIPMTAKRRGALTYAPAVIATCYLLLFLALAEGPSLIDSWQEWVEGAALGWAQFLFIPITAALLGCNAASAVWRVTDCWQHHSQDAESEPLTPSMVGYLGFFLTVNVVLVACAIVASCWLRANNIAPFQHGLWNVIVCFLPAPDFLPRTMAHPVGQVIVVLWTLGVSLMAIFLQKRTGHGSVIGPAGLLSFVLSGYPALWVAGSAFVNYYTFDIIAGVGSLRP